VIYLDTSALAKNYIKEDGSGSINKIIADSPVIAISKITYPEILSALIRRNKTGDISNRELIKLITEFESNWDYFIIVDFKDELLPLIKTVIQKHLLKAADAIHLS
jgi:predicted nucleic acid-binding protein